MKEVICIQCPRGCHLSVDEDKSYAVTGNGCERGIEYGKKELVSPTRTITSTVRISGASYPRCPVKTNAPIPKELVFDAMKEIDKVLIKAPVRVGDVVIPNLFGTQIDVIVTKSMAKIK